MATIIRLTDQNKNSKIFRFKLSDEIMLLITQFAKMHQYDDRHTYKEAWQLWFETHDELLEREIKRLNQLGYTGDVEDKMFKAGRYYFREKKEKKRDNEEQEKKEAKQPEKQPEKQPAKKQHEKEKRNYIVMNQTVIQAMDTHLLRIMQQLKFKPATGYVNFCEEHIDLLRSEIKRLTAQQQPLTAEKLADKIKKTYKNRYFILSQQTHTQA
jgi:hypothetical protein